MSKLDDGLYFCHQIPSWRGVICRCLRCCCCPLAAIVNAGRGLMMEGHSWGFRSLHSRSNPNTVTKCRCPPKPPPPTPHPNTLRWSAASFIAFKSVRGQGLPARSIPLDPLSLEPRRGGVNQTLTDDPSAKLLASTKEVCDGLPAEAT